MEDIHSQQISDKYHEAICELLSMNAKILSQQDNILSQCQEKNAEDFIISIIKRIKLKNNELVFVSEKEEFMKCNFNEYFKKISNIFNDVLPSSNKYFDLSTAIEKYSLLSPLNEKTNKIVFEWKTQLGSIMEFFSNKKDGISKIINKEKEKSLLFREELKIQIEDANTFAIVKKRDFIDNFEFDLRITDETNDELASFVNILKKTFLASISK